MRKNMQKNVQNNMQKYAQYAKQFAEYAQDMHKICIKYKTICKTICRICRSLSFAYFTYICTPQSPQFADAGCLTAVTVDGRLALNVTQPSPQWNEFDESVPSGYSDRQNSDQATRRGRMCRLEVCLHVLLSFVPAIPSCRSPAESCVGRLSQCA